MLVLDIDTKYLYHNVSCNKKNITFFFYNKKVHMTNNLMFKKHDSHHC